mmetsp:Transcript_33873/g.73215  ORF Transcript_33873/g.73215 Transcript_33873/m.73215 type:complete len:205 (-) Transcript_33873:118-732(-)
MTWYDRHCSTLPGPALFCVSCSREFSLAFHGIMKFAPLLIEAAHQNGQEQVQNHKVSKEHYKQEEQGGQPAGRPHPIIHHSVPVLTCENLKDGDEAPQERVKMRAWNANGLVTITHWTLCSVILRSHQASILWVKHKGATKEALRHQGKNADDQEKQCHKISHGHQRLNASTQQDLHTGELLCQLEDTKHPKCSQGSDGRTTAI